MAVNHNTNFLFLFELGLEDNSQHNRINKKVFQSNANCPLADNPCFIENKSEHVQGARVLVQ